MDHLRFFVAGIVGVSLAVTPAQAQFGGILGTAASDAQSSSDSGCETGKKKSTAGRIFGGLLRGAAQSAASSAGISSWVPVGEVAGVLTDSIACRLDPDEQKQAADATLEATRSLEDVPEDAPPVEVGTSASWTSASREDVSGTSTVTARLASADGADCITVTDVVIVKGEEARADKRMCRPPPPGSRRYTIVA